MTVYELNLWPPRLKHPPLIHMLIYQAVMGMIITNAAYVVIWQRIDYSCSVLCFFCAAVIRKLNECLGLEIVKDVADWCESECAYDMLSTSISILLLLWLLIATDTACNLITTGVRFTEKIREFLHRKGSAGNQPPPHCQQPIAQRRRNTDRL
ncbi:hypothetical protein L9F63_008353 [Diploptera punctata]|uniref:Uncharacterized protein n=1 Tax=Diploptera punctata TaxID=6984 RepID=A0AAD7Z5D0_DIPPU|nr:hypothetical protein L9F63_008353 [Diploptera punctata]